jgi:amino acid transporter
MKADVDRSGLAKTLRGNSVKTFGLVAQSMGATGVEINAFSVASVVALFAGALAPLAYLLACVAGIAYGRVIGKFAKSLVSAGGTYQFIRLGLGGPFGVFGGAIYIMGLFIFVPFTGVLSASTFSSMMASIMPSSAYFVSGQWLGITILEIVVAAVLAYRDLRVSAGFLIFLVVVGYVVILVFDIVVLAQLIPAGINLAAFMPWNVKGISFSGFAVALGLAMGGFFASETAAFLGEEAQAPKKTVPKAVMLSILLMMGLLVLNAFVVIAAVGTGNVSQFANQGAAIVLPLCAKYMAGWYGNLILLVVAVACFTSVLALFNAVARLLFDWGREGTLPARFGAVHGAHATPAFAVVVVAVASVLVTVVGLLWQPNTTNGGITLFSWALLAGALWILVGYILVGLSAIMQQWREGRDSAGGRQQWIGFLAPVIVVATMALSAVSQITPFPAPPLSTSPMFALAWVVVSAVIAIVWRQRYAGTTPVLPPASAADTQI